MPLNSQLATGIAELLDLAVELGGVPDALIPAPVLRHSAGHHRAPADLPARQRPDGGPGAGSRRLSVADQLVVFLLTKRWSMAQTPLAEATGLAK
ncbi:hypothetical protein ABZZ74_53780, partial [Streptomyces sp. NPDC006476]|uniref:hypothetical protein n=1 Tax=Streptomyces sp. NPDC006476 TaxID=3157175 RepID=UPI0033BB9E44